MKLRHKNYQNMLLKDTLKEKNPKNCHNLYLSQQPKAHLLFHSQTFHRNAR